MEISTSNIRRGARFSMALGLLGVAICSWASTPNAGQIIEVRQQQTSLKRTKPANAPAKHAFDEAIKSAAKQQGVDANLVKAVAWHESRLIPNAISTKGARGIMQLMPETAKRMGVEDAFNVEQSLYGGTRLLRNLLDRYGLDLPLALAAYNAGEGAVARYGTRIPPFQETERYVRDVIATKTWLDEGRIKPGETVNVVKHIALELGISHSIPIGKGLLINLPPRHKDTGKSLEKQL